MRNFKKVLAVILTVALLASMMLVPAMASVSNEAEALKLQAIGLMAGGSADLKLEEGVTRIQGLTFAIRAAGKEADALAMSDADVATELAKFTDSDTLPAWASKYTAYAIKNGITVGVGGGLLKPLEDISGTSFLVFVLKAGMGYATVTTATVADFAVASKVLTAGQAVAYCTKDALIRDDAAGILYGAAKNGVNFNGTTLIASLIASGFVDQAIAAAAGFVVPAPLVLKVVGATATNLKEIVVAFDSALDKDEAEDEANYSVEGKTVTKAKLNSDAKSVTLILDTHMANQSTFKVTVKTGVKTVADVALVDDVTVSGSVFDVTIPAVLSVAQAGPDSFKVTFSEPVVAPTGINFKVDGGLYFVNTVTAGDDNYSATVKLYTTLPTGEHKVEVSAVKDYATYSCVTTVVSFVAAKDEVAPTISNIVSASPEKVVIEFNEDIFAVVDTTDIAGKVYHTNALNVATTAAIDGKKLTLTFTNKLPNGTAYLTIAKEVVKDGWNNKNAEVKDLAISVTVDTTKPEVKTAKAETDKKIVITFTENINSLIVGTYKLLDATGKDVTSEYTITKTTGDDTRTLEFNKALSGSTYTVVVEGIKDLAGNEMDKISIVVPVTDTTAPEITTPGALYFSKNIVKISFNEVMNTDDILNLSNYLVGSKYLNATKATATLGDGGKAVLIDFTKDPTLFSTSMTVQVGRVRDVVGNYTASFATNVTFTNMDVTGIGIAKVEATGKKTLVVTLNDALAKFEADDFIVTNAVVSGVSFTNNADGKGVITFTITENLTTLAMNATTGLAITVATAADTINSENAYGVKVAASASAVTADDKISAEFAATTAFTANNTIKIVFTENVKPDTLSRFTFTVSGNTVTAAALSGDNGLIITLKDPVALDAKVTITQVLDIEDLESNVSKAMTKEITNLIP